MFRNNGLLHHNVRIAVGLLSLAQWWQTTLILCIHVFCDFWADYVHVAWLNAQLSAQIISQSDPPRNRTKYNPHPPRTRIQSSAG